MTLIIVIGFLFMIIGGFYLSIKYDQGGIARYAWCLMDPN